MAFAERAELVARLSLKDDFSGRVKGAVASLKGMEGSLGRISKLGAQGLGAATANLAKLGTVAGGFVALNVKSGISSLAELEDATTAVDGAIRQMGLTGRITAQQVATWANEIESSVQAAFDDKAITQAATTLLRFGKVTDANLRPALVVMTDLAAKTGDVEGAATLLAKALADPAKAAGKLARQGVILTKVEQDQIDALVKAGKTTEAQTLLLDALTKSTKGAAAASAGPYRDALNTFKDVTEDAQRALAEGFLPLLQRVAGRLSTFLGDQKNVDKIRDFGKGLAQGFDKLIDLGGRIPWKQIGDSMKIAGAGAKVLFDAFLGLPPWVQTAVLTGWGLNKLTGGALGGIVGELGKGLIKGVLGMNAGVVNIKAAVVNSGGLPAGGPNPTDVASKAALGLPSLATLGSAGAALAVGFIPVAAAGLLLAFQDKAAVAAADLAARRATVAARGGDPNAVPVGGTRAPRSAVPSSQWGDAAQAALKQQKIAIDRVQQVASSKLGNLERKATEGKTATDRSGSAIVSATRNEQGAVVSAINGMRLQNTTNLTINVPGQAPIYRTYQTGTTMNRVTTGVGSAALQRQTG